MEETVSDKLMVPGLVVPEPHRFLYIRGEQDRDKKTRRSFTLKCTRFYLIDRGYVDAIINSKRVFSRYLVSVSTDFQAS